ncbi:hypothetical protein [Streptomyces subrutilus]|uniref:Uncharacterized protein n=1 Tax=Streptomyces subrutilus TaxID=36818 RepID=A0A1E5NXB8_9ACTN|nr:hypothetical protein [Streptomyces subrutilus]OEJ20894.1 hypothetical protein BGK67_35250 [Streptomyces subrutilus]
MVHLPGTGPSRSDVDRRAPELPPGFTREAKQVHEDPAQPGLDELRIQRLMTAAINRWGWLAR